MQPGNHPQQIKIRKLQCIVQLASKSKFQRKETKKDMAKNKSPTRQDKTKSSDKTIKRINKQRTKQGNWRISRKTNTNRSDRPFSLETHEENQKKSTTSNTPYPAG